MPEQDISAQPSGDLVVQLEGSRRLLMDAIAGLDEEGFRARPDAGEWTIAELLAHLFSTEQIFIDRARRAIERENYVATPVGDDIREEHLGMAKRMPVPQMVHGLLAQRRDTLQFVEALSPEDLSRTLSHPVRGEQTTLWQIKHTIEHEREHAGQIRELRAAAAGTKA